MLTATGPALFETCWSTTCAQTVRCNCKNIGRSENNERSKYNSKQNACRTYNTHAVSNEKQLFNKKYSLLLGVYTSNQMKCMLSRQLRSWRACRRHRKRRKSKSVEKKSTNIINNNNNNNNKINNTFRCNMRTTCARCGKIRRRRCVLSCQMTNNSNSFFAAPTTTRTTPAVSLLLADYMDNGMLHEARNKRCLLPEVRAIAENDVSATKMVSTLPPPTKSITTTRSMLKLANCKRWLNKQRPWATMSGARREQISCSDMLPPQQQQKLVKQQFPTPTTAKALSSRLPTDGERVLLEEQVRTHEQQEIKEGQQEQQQQQHCLQQTHLRQGNNEQHRSWRNLIGCVTHTAHTRTQCTVANVINTITTTTITTTNTPTTKATNSTTPAALLAENIYTQKTDAPATVDITATRKTTTIPILRCLFHRERLDEPCIASATHKSKHRCSSQALTSALRPSDKTTTPSATTKQIFKDKNATKKIKLAESNTRTVVFGDILRLVFGVLTLRATVLRCLLLPSVVVMMTMMVMMATATALPLVEPSSQHLLTQHNTTSEKLYSSSSSSSSSGSSNSNNNNHIDNNSPLNGGNSHSNNSTFTSPSAQMYNHRPTQLSLATSESHLRVTPAPASLTRMLDIEVLNGSSSSSGHSANTLKSLSSTLHMDGLQEFGQEDVNQLPIFDFGLPRNITARTGQTEATIKCRVERLDDKSVSWIRKRDLHILTVATATYTSDKRFQVTSSKDGREWVLHVKSPQARDTGIYECQVNTEPKMSMAFQLNIIEIPADSRAIISGPADLHFKVGSAIILNCHVQQPSVRDIGPIYWYRGEHIITPFELDDDEDDEDSKRSASNNKGHIYGNATPALADNELEVDVTATITNANAFAGVGAGVGRTKATTTTTTSTVTTTNALAAQQHDGLSNEITPDFKSRISMESQLGDTMKSRLRISNAQTTDTGNYTCQPTTASSASVMVHVINDENPAAMQKSSASSIHTTTTTQAAAMAKLQTNTLLLLLLIAIATATTTTITTVLLETLMTGALVITSTTAIKSATTTTTHLLSHSSSSDTRQEVNRRCRGQCHHRQQHQPALQIQQKEQLTYKLEL